MVSQKMQQHIEGLHRELLYFHSVHTTLHLIDTWRHEVWSSRYYVCTTLNSCSFLEGQRIVEQSTIFLI
jgi:hypothetical protein